MFLLNIEVVTTSAVCNSDLFSDRFKMVKKKFDAAERDLFSFLFHTFFSLSKLGTYITHNATQPDCLVRDLGVLL